MEDKRVAEEQVKKVGEDSKKQLFQRLFSEEMRFSFDSHFGYSLSKEEADTLEKMEWRYKWPLPSTGSSYQDILHHNKKPFYAKGISEDSKIMDAYIMHSLNHLFKSKDIITKNNIKLAKHEENAAAVILADERFLDHGFTRPKVLILLPFASIAFRFVRRLIQLTPSDQKVAVENLDRFQQEFGTSTPVEYENMPSVLKKFKCSYTKPVKPSDFQALFDGNNNDRFMIGEKFTRKSIKLYSNFHQSDLIIASPLRLKIAEAVADKEKDVDYLSSVEVAVKNLDHFQQEFGTSTPVEYEDMPSVLKKFKGSYTKPVKPSDFQALFYGNNNDRFMEKHQVVQQFSSVDLIIASPLRLVNLKMVSDASKKKAAQKKAAAAAKRGGKVAASSSSKVAANLQNGVDKVTNGVDELKISDRTCTGVLCSHPLSRDIRIELLSVTFHGHDLIVDSELELNYGRRYGLLGLNGCGKSTLLTAIGRRELPIPDHMDIYHLTREIEASDMSALEADDGGGEALERVYERLDALDASTAEKRAAEILFGLGFNKQMQAKKTKDFSGGWRMRIVLARALFMNPTILLLDEPTNHLDLEACVWLEETIKKFDHILVVISHSQDFLNGVCTNIIHMQNKKLKIYTGNFDQYVQTRAELEENQMKQYKWEQEQIASMKEYIARFGHGSAKLARQAQSKEKTLAKMERGGLTEKVARDKILVFRFTDVGKLPPPVLQFVEVSFGYTPDNLIYKNLDFGVDLDSRIALVGPNGAGKSTLLKLMTGDLVPTDGMVRRHNHLKIAQFHQHLSEKLDLELSALQFMIKEYSGNEEERMRAAIGKFGLSGKAQIMPMKNLSDGQRSRVIFAWLAYRQLHLLLLDEPTNHLDIETIDSLAQALNEWDGGLVLVSHDFRLINQVAQEIWVCENQTASRWEGDIMDFKEHLKSKAGLSD
ncbi:unnamed protein product [Rhodiola kirilowii]